MTGYHWSILHESYTVALRITYYHINPPPLNYQNCLQPNVPFYDILYIQSQYYTWHTNIREVNMWQHDIMMVSIELLLNNENKKMRIIKE